MSAMARKTRAALFRARRNVWRWDPRFRRGADVAIDRPIFLLGTQGAGLTLLSRILRRHPLVVGATGGHRYWAGADEGQNVFAGALPPHSRCATAKPARPTTTPSSPPMPCSPSTPPAPPTSQPRRPPPTGAF